MDTKDKKEILELYIRQVDSQISELEELRSTLEERLNKIKAQHLLNNTESSINSKT